MKEINVLELLPQQRPFVMIDRLLYQDEKLTTGSLKIRPDNIFVEDNIFTAPGLIESVAQTAAARMGYINRIEQEESQGEGKIKLGFIGAIKNFVIEKCPQVDDEITINIEIVSEVFAILLIHAWVSKNDELLASGEMKISITNIDSQT
jgi:3-hydroxymyristoyl/3-hydroxydecanoyl-(acyl carrier protein) dehydratase